uniref:Putative secreted protein n=1 Tax=Ixodes ricinus TaxID=34613 RepID=A0A6B0U332_IXORI
MTGIVRCSANALIVAFLFLCCGLSSLVRPWTPSALTPVDSINLPSARVSSSLSRTLILQVTGKVVLCTNAVRMAFTLSNCVSRAAPIPPCNAK